MEETKSVHYQNHILNYVPKYDYFLVIIKKPRT